MLEKRAHPRTPCNIAVSCTVGENSFSGVALDVSIGGMFIETPVAPPAFGSQLTIAFALPGSDRELSVEGVVRWNKPSGFGVQFGLLGARDTHALTEFSRANR